MSAPKDIHAELMRLADRFATTSRGGLAATRRYALEDFSRKLTDRITELEAQLEAVGAGGVLSLTGAKQCPGIPRAGCNYLTTCNSVCNKCGNVHHTHQLTADQPALEVVGPMALQEVSVKHWAQRALEAQPKSDPEYWPLSYKAGHMEDELIELRAALKAAIAAGFDKPQQIAEPASQWLPIETAPKDGRTLLLGYFNPHKNWRTMRGKWMSEDYIAENWEEPDDGGPGWYETVVEHDNTPNCWFTEPKYWMPLPPAPKEPS